MPLSPGFQDHVLELLEGLGPVQVKRMFGGALVSRDGVGFAILDDDICFIKADQGFGAELKRRGSNPWKYSVNKDGTVRDVAYWSLPDTAMDDAEEACGLAQRSLAAAVKADAAKKKPKAKTPKAAPAKAASKAVAKPARKTGPARGE